MNFLKYEMAQPVDNNNQMQQPTEEKKKFYNNRVPSLWVLKFSQNVTDSDTSLATFVVAAKNVVHARKRMKNSFNNNKFAHENFPDSTLDLTETHNIKSFNPSNKEWSDHESFEDMIDNAWLQPFAENMLVFSTINCDSD